jgi:hypothetical protein
MLTCQVSAVCSRKGSRAQQTNPLTATDPKRTFLPLKYVPIIERLDDYIAEGNAVWCL